MRDEVGLAAHVDVALVGAAAQPLVQGSTVTLLLAAVQLPDQDVVGTQHFVLAVGAKPVGKMKLSSACTKNVLGEQVMRLNWGCAASKSAIIVMFGLLAT